MLKLFRGARAQVVDFCDRCRSVCTAACRQRAALARARDTVLHHGGRIS